MTQSYLRLASILAVGAFVFGLAAPAMSQQSPSPAKPAAPAQEAPSTPVPPTGDSVSPREVTLEPRTVLILKGESTWDDGYENLLKAFETLRSEAKRLGLTVIGKPQTAFQETDDQKFKYDAMMFIDKEPAADAKLNAVTIGKSLAGKAYVFNHVGAYDDIDSVYEAITAWLDEKNLVAKGAFVEEYVNEPQGSDDAKLELNIYVFVQ